MQWSMMRASPAAVALGKGIQSRSVPIRSIAANIDVANPPEDRRHPQSTLTNCSISRPVTSSPNTEDPTQILAKQRLNRPIAPHLSIYRPQIGWIGSSLHRITGLALSGTLYLWATAYLASPALGWHLESASMVAAMGALPLAAKVAIKSTLALPFTYHCLNGVRHLVWDTGRALSNPAIIKSGWTVVGLSVASALALAFI
jgi:succinate dehydrogenase (ubiquinone) cytochrome b560 subunit